MSLSSPTEKMSKSAPQRNSRILISDSSEEIRGKIMSALTDNVSGVSHDREGRPGVTNLVELMYHFDAGGAESPQALAQDLKDMTMRALKEKVAETVEEGVRDIRGRYEELMGGDQKVLLDYAEDGARRAESIAEETMERVRPALGLQW